jgi:hypothetical protein
MKRPAEKGFAFNGVNLSSGRQMKHCILFYSGCQKNVPIFKRFFLQPYTRLCRNSVIA